MKDLQKIKEFFSKETSEGINDFSPLSYAKKVANGEMSIEAAMEETGFPFTKLAAMTKAINPKYSAQVTEEETEVSNDAPDIIAVDVPLFIRLLEFAREDAGDDMDLHEVAERAIEAVKMRGVLSMDDYNTLIPPKEELDEKMLVPKDKIERMAADIAAKYFSSKADKKPAIEILQQAIRDAYKALDPEAEIQEGALGFRDIDKFGKEAASKIDNAVRGDSRYTFGNNPYADDQLRYEYAKKFGYVNEAEGYSPQLVSPENPKGKTQGLDSETMSKILMKIMQDIEETKQLGENLNEELCPKGKAYIKKRMAAGEKSSAYLSGRAVKVCKGQMKG